MKVLFLANFIYEPELKPFRKNPCGFGIMVNDILNAISSLDEVFLLTRAFTGKRQYNNYTILRHSRLDFIKGIRAKTIVKGIKAFFECPQGLKMKLRYLYYELDTERVRESINELKPDIVHIHGLSYSSNLYISLCKDMNVAYIVTLHGLIGLDKSVVASSYDIALERNFLIESSRNGQPITMISSGMRKRSEKFYGLENIDNIHVITNGINVKSITSTTSTDVRKKMGLNNLDKVLISVGNITVNKNQIQVIEAVALLDQSLRKNIKVIFAGKDILNGRLQERAEQLGVSDNFIFLGFVDREELKQLYIAADLNIFTSLNDGFGIPIVEGFVHGVPVLTFDDLDAFDDIYDMNTMIVPKDRTNEAVARAIEKALYISWDNLYIREYSEKFSLDKMAVRYHEVYEKYIS